MKSFYEDFHPVVLDVKENAERESGKRNLGVHPETNRDVSVRLGKFGSLEILVVYTPEILIEGKPEHIFTNIDQNVHCRLVILLD